MKYQVLLASAFLLGIGAYTADARAKNSGLTSAKAACVTILNNNAIVFPKPEYPESAKAVGASGTVNIKVTVDEEGNVITAEAVSGHPLLRAVSVTEAKEAKFKPFLVEGKPSKIAGNLIYNFADTTAPKSEPASADKDLKLAILNGGAISLPKPDTSLIGHYGADGVVNVQVTIDESGNVIEAKAISGHAALRSASEAAALQAKFKPLPYPAGTYTGILVYNFGYADARQNERSESGPSSHAIRIVTRCVVNGTAVSLPRPSYPATASAVGASGAVNVNVTIDEQGDVVEADAVSGHPLLRPSSVAAAKEAKFKPLLISGQPKKVSGIIVYNFVP